MNIITRYLVKEFLKPLLFSSVVFGGLVLLSEFFRELNFYLEKKASFVYVFEYLFLNLPWWIIQVLPVAVLLAVLFSLGGLARSGEITAIKAAGINLWRIIGLLIICGIVIGLIDVILREKIIPYTTNRAEYIRISLIKKENIETQFEHHNLVISLPENGRMTIGYLNANLGRVENIVIDYYNKDFVLVSQLVSPQGSFDGKNWHMENGVERIFNGNRFSEAYFAKKIIGLPFTPEDFIHVGKRPEQMSFKEQKKYISRLKNIGIPVEKEVILMHLRWALPLSHLIVMFLGIPFALSFGSKHGKILSFTFALIFASFYWAVQAIGQSLGENKVVSPILAAWLGNIVFGFIGIILLIKVKK
ncbi:MAG: LptF/LptG family permease [Elusimicrobia bacterium]|nr:LptF/LptG family permease [Candidatus Liberimonas magnetica]